MSLFLRRLLSFYISLIIMMAAIGVAAFADHRIQFLLFGQPTKAGNTYERITEFNNLTEPPEILMLGSSTCYRGVNPNELNQFGHDAFNLCSSAQTFHNSQFLLDWALSTNKKPQVLILDIYPGTWNIKGGIESTQDLIINNNIAFEYQFQKMAFSTLEPQTTISAIYFGLSRLIRPIRYIEPSTDEYQSGGFTYSNRPPVQSYQCPEHLFELNCSQEHAFQNIYQKCLDHEIQLILLNPPQLCTLNIETPITMVGTAYIDGNEWPQATEDSMYYDNHHLRGIGAESYSLWLGEQLSVYLKDALQQP